MMEIDVGAEEQTVMDNVETVEVVASGDDVSSMRAVHVGVGLMDQHMIVTSPEGILVPTSEVSAADSYLCRIQSWAYHIVYMHVWLYIIYSFLIC